MSPWTTLRTLARKAHFNSSSQRSSFSLFSASFLTWSSAGNNIADSAFTSKACTRERSLSFSILYTPLRCLAQHHKKLLKCLILFCQRSSADRPPASLAHYLATRSKKPSLSNQASSKEKHFYFPSGWPPQSQEIKACDQKNHV